VGEKTGLQYAILIFGVFFIPFLLALLIDSIHTHQFMQVTTDVQKVVDEEGGVTSRVQSVVDDLKKKGINVSFYDQKGNVISGKQPVGQEIIIKYRYNDKEFFGISRPKETSNTVIVAKR